MYFISCAHLKKKKKKQYSMSTFVFVEFTFSSLITYVLPDQKQKLTVLSVPVSAAWTSEGKSPHPHLKSLTFFLPMVFCALFVFIFSVVVFCDALFELWTAPSGRCMCVFMSANVH